MTDWVGTGKMVAVVGVLLVLVGGLMTLIGKISGTGNGLGWLGKLPGDILIKRDSFSFYFPLTTGLLISVILSLAIYLLSLLKR